MGKAFELKLKGPQAVLVILVLIGIGGFQWLRLGVNFVGSGPEPAIEHWLWNAYHTGELQDALDEAAKELTDAKVEKVLAAQVGDEALRGIDVTRLSARRAGEDEYVIRIEFLLGGNPPPDGKSPRYLRVEKRSPGGWFVRHETSAFSYYAAFL